MPTCPTCNQSVPEPDKRPRCGYCGLRILWDWCQDTYVIKTNKGWVYGKSEAIGNDDDAQVNYCVCGSVLNVVSPYGGVVLDVHAPTKVDWQLPENSFPLE